MTKNLNILKNLSFTKMQALGNDFIIINGTKQKINLSPQLIQRLADRHFGIGCDQILLLEPPKNPKADFYYRIFNADGKEVNQCGNGVRCVALFVKDQGLTSKKKLRFETHCGIITTHILKDNIVRVNMGSPEQNPDKIPFISKTKKTTYPLLVNSLKKKFNICALSFGNPHCILWTKMLEKLPVDKIGALLSKHPRFPEETNVGFTKVLDRQTILLRVFERGVGETLACGSAACAAMVASKLLDLVDNEVDVLMKGGKVTVQWQGKGTPVWLTGPAEFVFSGKVIS